MGQRHEYSCAGCDAQAVVSGGSDVGMASRTVTIGCRACAQLTDVVVSTIEDGDAFFHDLDMPGDDLPACPTCRASATVKWHRGDPCPRCRGAVVDTGCVIELWD